MKQDQRIAFDEALAQARRSAYRPGEYVEQESFMSATQIRSLAVRAGVAPGVRVLDLCCGVGGPGRFIAEELGCSYLGVDSSAEAIAIARERAITPACRFEVSRIPPLPTGWFDVVLLLETMLAFSDKETLLRDVCAVLPEGGRFAFTVEEGAPLSAAERTAMPDADTVWPVPLAGLLRMLERAGFQVSWSEECSCQHQAMADALTGAFAAGAVGIAEQIGRRAVDELLSAHRLWSEWLREGRVRKFAFVVEKTSHG